MLIIKKVRFLFFFFFYWICVSRLRTKIISTNLHLVSASLVYVTFYLSKLVDCKEPIRKLAACNSFICLVLQVRWSLNELDKDLNFILLFQKEQVNSNSNYSGAIDHSVQKIMVENYKERKKKREDKKKYRGFQSS